MLTYADVCRLEARMREFIRQLDTGHLHHRASRKLTNDAGEEVVRCRCQVRKKNKK
jgi:hypothetical protein